MRRTTKGLLLGLLAVPALTATGAASEEAAASKESNTVGICDWAPGGPAPCEDVIGTSMEVIRDPIGAADRAIAVPNVIPASEASLAAAPTCQTIRFFNSDGVFVDFLDAHAADGVFNAGFAEAGPSADGDALELEADATSTGGNDATSWGRGGTGFAFNITNNSPDTALTIFPELVYSAAGEGAATSAALSAGNVFGIELGGSAGAEANLNITGFSALLSPNELTQGPTGYDTSVIDGNTEVELGDGEIRGGDATLNQIYEHLDLPAVLIDPLQSRQALFFVYGDATVKGETGGTGTATARGVWEVNPSRSGEIKADYIDLTIGAPFVWESDRCIYS